MRARKREELFENHLRTTSPLRRPRSSPVAWYKRWFSLSLSPPFTKGLLSLTGSLSFQRHSPLRRIVTLVFLTFRGLPVNGMPQIIHKENLKRHRPALSFLLTDCTRRWNERRSRRYFPKAPFRRTVSTERWNEGIVDGFWHGAILSRVQRPTLYSNRFCLLACSPACLSACEGS